MRFCIPWVILTLLPQTTVARQQPDSIVQFNRDVRPVLSDKCYFCHGPDPAQREAGLRLDIREVAVEQGAIDEDDWENSLLLERIQSDDPDFQMPPPDSNKSLSDLERDVLTRWIQQGALYQAHWSYAPLARPDIPDIGSAENRPANPIDAFVLKGISDSSQTPAPRADSKTLVRRLSMDLLGLPPKWDEVSEFVNDDNDASWLRKVDEYLAQPQYGERMASPWLDVVRYADTVGFHGDQNQNAWAYRDWAIRAFNENKRFDEFTIEQLAGDLLPSPTTDQLVATCFNRLNMMTREGGAQPGEYLAKYFADRVRTVSTAWLGSTMGCAECHDHKYDPFTSRDFYSMGAFFADVQQWGVYNDYAYTPNPDLRGFNNDYPFPPEIETESAFLIGRIDSLRQEQNELVGKYQVTSLDGFNDWAGKIREFLTQHPDGWEIATPWTAVDGQLEYSRQIDGSIVFSGDNATELELIQPGTIASVRIELLPSAEQGDSIRRDGKLDPFDLNPLIRIRRNGIEELETIPIHLADADRKTLDYANGFAMSGITSGWRTAAGGMPHTGVYVFRSPIRLNDGDRVHLDCRDNKQVSGIRVSFSPLVPNDTNDLHQMKSDALFAGAGGEHDGTSSNAQSDPVPGDTWQRMAYVRSSGSDIELLKQLQAIDQEIVNCRHGKTPVLTTKSIEPSETRILSRGNWQDTSGEIVAPAVPHFLPQPGNDDGRRLTRLDLARWLVADDNPLVARVVMNRLWQQFFGQGLSARSDDFGAQGASPTHPELLDWLASEFRESGWDVKHMVRLIVTSETYRRSTQSNSDLLTADADNQLLARQRPRRLSAEMVRDNGLAIAGLLQADSGGPPIKPYQPTGYYANLQFPDRRYEDSPVRDQFRRGIYMHWQRAFLHPMLANFDAPSREDCIAMRNEANNPQQALTLLNDPAFVEMSVAFAARVLKAKGEESVESQIQFAYQCALLREPNEMETGSLVYLLDELKAVYDADRDAAKALIDTGLSMSGNGLDPVLLAAWANVCRVILNLHETITRY